MFTRTIRLFEPQAAPTTAAALYTVPANTRCRLTKITATNTGTSVRAVTAYLVPTGDSAAAANTIVSGFAIGPKQDIALSSMIGHNLEAGDSLQIIVDVGSDCIIHATGIEVTV